MIEGSKLPPIVGVLCAVEGGDTVNTKPARRRQHQPRVRMPDGLLTMAEAAAKLGCSIKTLKAHVEAGALSYVVIGRGSKRPRKMFTAADLNEFIANQTRKDSPACPSTATRARHSGNSTSSGDVIAFSAQPKPQTGGKPKK
jgi:Helix-turn-helix domain